MFQNNIEVIENRMISFCSEQFTTHGHYYQEFYPIISQNSKYVKPGDEIEITTGIGAFTNANKPEIIIDGKKVPTGEIGLAIAKFKAFGKPGKHFVPVQVSYIDQEGKKQTITKTVEYTIAKE